MQAPASQPLQGYREIWNRKPVLRVIYDDFYGRIAAAARPGRTIEIGGGIGNLKERLRHVVATDIQAAPWLDCVADAQRLPFATASATNIVMVDVLHHLEFPIMFFREAARVLRPGGRVLMAEPAITWGSTAFYRLFHHEPVRTSADALAEGIPHPGRDPYEGNQAIPTVLATREAYHGWTYLTDAVSTSFADNPAALETRPDWVHTLAAPNPFRGALTIALFNASTAPAEAEIAVFDLAGRGVGEVWRGVVPAVWHRVAWNAGARLPAGVYVVRAGVAGVTLSRRIVRVE